LLLLPPPLRPPLPLPAASLLPSFAAALTRLLLEGWLPLLSASHAQRLPPAWHLLSPVSHKQPSMMPQRCQTQLLTTASSIIGVAHHVHYSMEMLQSISCMGACMQVRALTTGAHDKALVVQIRATYTQHQPHAELPAKLPEGLARDAERCLYPST
jgi:hypothetical protein